MTEIQFHFNVPDRLLYTCRLLRKALRSGAAGVTVTGAPSTLARLDRGLWTFDDLEFIPHLLVRRGETVSARFARTPIWLVEDSVPDTPHPVRVHLGEEPAVGFESCGRLIEIVATDPEERDAARARWRHYAGRGYELKRFDAGGVAP